MSVWLITGGTGFIGSRLALYCAARGIKVRAFGLIQALTEKQNRALLATCPGVRVIEGNILDRSALQRALKDVDVVFHLAAAQHEAGRPAEHFTQINVEGTRALAKAATECGVRRIVHGSTIGVYEPEALVTQNSPLRPVHVYGRTKLAGETLLREEFGRHLETVVLRLSETYGPHDRRLLKMFRVIAAGQWIHWGPADNAHQPIYVDDLTQLLFAAATAEGIAGRTLVAAGQESVTSRQMADAIADALGVPRPQRTLPLGPILALAQVLEAVSRPLGVTPPLHRRRLDFFRRAFAFDTLAMEQALGVQPRTTFARGARLTAAWYRKTGLLPAATETAAPLTAANGSPSPTPR